MDPVRSFDIRLATAADVSFAERIREAMAASTNVRGTGIARRTQAYVARKMEEGKAVIAFTDEGAWAGFGHIGTWGGDHVANSGLIVSREFRNGGIARRITERIRQQARESHPTARVFGHTTGLAVMKISSDPGYEPVLCSEVTQDATFRDGCKRCQDQEVLLSKERRNCMCTALLYDPARRPAKSESMRGWTGRRTPDEALVKTVVSDSMMKDAAGPVVLRLDPGLGVEGPADLLLEPIAY